MGLGMPHLLVYGPGDDLQHVITASLEDAMVYAEYLANERNERSFRVFELNEVEMAVKRFYSVELTASAMLESTRTGGPFEANAAVGDPVDNVCVLPPLTQPVSGPVGPEDRPATRPEVVWRPPVGTDAEVDEDRSERDGSDSAVDDGTRFGTGLRLELPRILHRPEPRNGPSDRVGGSPDGQGGGELRDEPSGGDGFAKPQLSLAAPDAVPDAVPDATTADDLDDLLDSDELRDGELPEAISASR